MEINLTPPFWVLTLFYYLFEKSQGTTNYWELVPSKKKTYWHVEYTATKTRAAVALSLSLSQVSASFILFFYYILYYKNNLRSFLQLFDWCVLVWASSAMSSKLESWTPINSKHNRRMGLKFPMIQLRTSPITPYFAISCHRKHSRRILSEQKFPFKFVRKSLGDRWKLHDISAGILILFSF